MTRSLSLRARSMLATVVATLGVALVGTLGYVWLRAEVDRSDRFIDREFAASASIGRIHAGIANARRYEKDLFLNLADPGLVDRYEAQWRRALDAAVGELDALAPRVDDASVAQIATLRDGLRRYASGVGGIVARIRAGELRDPRAANAAMEPLKDSVRAADGAFESIRERTAAAAEASRTSMHEAAGLASLTLGLTVLAVLGGVVPILLLNGRAIVRAIARVRGVAERIAAGDLGAPVDTSGGDEAAAMMRALATMQDSLRDLVGQVRTGVESVSTASREISLGNTDLSRRTEQQAANLQQTSASMRQISDAVRRHAADAQGVMRVVASVTSSADQGGAQVRLAVEAMAAIAESSRRIGEISRVVDAIAFQTNLLALNAAVEAARAGEQGRGFAVVAAEVRTLAKRCATAAREIGALIEESGKRVDAGGVSVADAGRTIDRVVVDVREIGTLVEGLVDATQTQAASVEQVGTAIAQLDELTQRNAALVEQSAAAAMSMDEQAQALAGAIGRFGLEPAAAR